MADRAKFQAIKGVRDILPPESALWNSVEQAARDVFGTFGFAEIRLPIFEETELFARSIGEHTDVVGKEMYTFGAGFDPDSVKESLPGRTISLRPEATASVVRAYIEHGMQVLPGNVKLYYMGPMFRRERPQKGRYRQFYQIGAEVLGSSDAPGIDAEVIEMLLAFFERLKLKGAVLHINSIGDKNCRPAYVERLRAGPEGQCLQELQRLRWLLRRVRERLRELSAQNRAPELLEMIRGVSAELEAWREELQLGGLP